MLFPLRQQIFYSFLGLILFAAFPWLLFLLYGPEDISTLGQIEFFEAGKLIRFPVNQLSPALFTWIRVGYLILVLLFGLLTLPFFKPELQLFPQKLKNLFRLPVTFIRQEIKSLTNQEELLAGITFLIILLERIYYLFQYPIHTDEAASYFLFIQNGPVAIASFYPVPNNHLLQNLLAWPLTLIFTEPFWVLRLPPLFFSLLLTVFGFGILKRFSGFLTAYLATALFSFGSFTLFLSTQGRGYILLTLFAAFSVALIFQAIKTAKSGYWVCFSFVSALGFFVVPTFVYPFAICAAFAGLYFIFHSRWFQLLNLIFAVGFALLAVGVLYSPLLLISGPKALFGNPYLQALTPEDFKARLPEYLKDVQGILLGGKSGNGLWCFYLSSALLFLVFLFQRQPFLKKQLPNRSSWLAGLVLVSSLVVYSLLRFQLLLPPPRVLFFKSFFDFIGVAILLSILLQLVFKNLKLRLTITFIGVIIFAGFQVLAAEAFLKDYPQPYYNFPALTKQIYQTNARRVYVEEPFYQLFLRYEYSRFQKKIRIENEVTNPNQLYDYVVLEHTKTFPPAIPDSLYRQVYQDELVKAYRPKKAW